MDYNTLEEKEEALVRQGATKTVSKFNTFCSLCSKKINAGEWCYEFTTEDKKGKTHQRAFLVHRNCEDEEVKTRMHKAEFQQNAKKKGNRKSRGKTSKGKALPYSGARGVDRGKLFYGK